MKKLLKILIIITVFFSIISCNKKPDIPICISPKDGAANITDSVLTLKWSCSDPNGDKLVFDIFLTASEEGIITDNNIIVEGTENFNCKVQNLKDNTTYLWEVKATDTHGKFSINAWTFTTGKIEK